MYCRNLSPRILDKFNCNLEANAHQEPIDASYYYDIVVIRARYRLRFVMDGCKIYIFQAVKMNDDMQSCVLLTHNSLLAALTELLVEEYGGRDSGS